jgi:hypothetical protein
MAQVTELSVAALPGMVHSFVAKASAIATAPTVPGMEWTLDETHPHWTLDETHPHWTPDSNPINWTLDKE